MTNEDIVAVDSKYAEAAGAIVWWDLSGTVDAMDFEDAWFDLGGDETRVAKVPAIDVTIQRAARAACRDPRLLVRPLRNFAWDVQAENVQSDDAGNEGLKYETAVRIRVTKDEGVKSAAVTSADEANGYFNSLRDSILAESAKFRAILTPDDISSWLLWVLRDEVQAVSLRRRGGFYFVPQDRIPYWKMVKATLAQVSDHSLSEIPAMRAEDTVAAVLGAVRAEAEDVFKELDEYLGGEKLSTRGLNSVERRANEVQAKVAKYAELMGQALPDLEQRAVTLKGAAVAARLERERAK